jgi:hypothetical protein
MLACLHEILIVFFLNIHAKFGWKAFLIFSFLVLMISSEKPYLRSSCSAIKSLNFSVLYFSHHLFLAASESACLLGFDGGKYCNLKWFVIYCSEKSFKLIININGMSLNLVPGKLPEEQ